MEDTTTLSVTKPIRCIVKLGGAAITCKNDLEKINEENVEIVSSQLREAMITGSSSRKVLGMDWSKRPGKSGISCDADDFEDQNLDSSSFVVVHGAGSFGHFQASKSGVHKGGLNKPLVKAGFVATRISVTTLNLEIVRALARDFNFQNEDSAGEFYHFLSLVFIFSLRAFLPLECLHFHVDGQLLKEMLEALRNECICLLIWLKYGTFRDYLHY
ncbi:Aspartate/glutamate/uridylate kinase [Populus alba x Populus x berolinensis]|uniref:Aspartate/glutamate/uridylate kinase n=1 Tax=Populus alba x Populus x berolinensis TaxID=444605 RepID=A0AAD6QBC8_9ROSI|nr:Aspartate/glutamate/uridylate kinase [Populus alba x Populus x berolinensis]KAJ6983858.1 Aspartate/glutamate/uridylate kinase [Populus alba x Populus x berolinensis]